MNQIKNFPNYKMNTAEAVETLKLDKSFGSLGKELLLPSLCKASNKILVYTLHQKAVL